MAARVTFTAMSRRDKPERGLRRRRRKMIVGLAFAAWLGALGGLGFVLARDADGDEPGPPNETATTTVVPTTSKTSGPGVILGARILGGTQPDQPSHGRSDRAERARIEGLIGRKFGLERIYYTWWEDWPTGYAFRTAKAGRIPLISFNSRGYTWRQIANGEGDAWLRQRYQKMEAHPELIAAILIFDSEPEGDSSTKGTPSDYVAAFRHVVEIARDEQLPNHWATALQAYTVNSNKGAQKWWPGNDYVDFAGWDIYGARVNTPTVQDCSAEGWRSFREEAARPYQFAQEHGKPMIIPELGQREDPDDPGRKARWLQAMSVDLRTFFPNIVAIAWAHSDFDGICPYSSTWWIDTSPQALAAFKALAADRYFQGSERHPPRVFAAVEDR